MFDVRQEITAGNTLVREAIQSQNFVSGSAGWQIKADGSAQFSNIIIRGSGVFGPNPGKHVDINLTFPGAIGVFTGDPSETNPGLIGPNTSGTELRNTFSAPQHAGTAHVAEIWVSTNAFDQALFVINCPLISVLGQMSFSEPTLSLTQGWVTFGQTAPVPLLVNSWVDLAGSRVGYLIDSSGNVQLRGVVVSGVATLIATLPATDPNSGAPLRPSQAMEFIMRGQGGVVMCAVQVATNGQITVTANAATAEASGIKLDAIQYHP